MSQATPAPTVIDRVRYENAAQDYLAGLTMENFMEATAQGTQREITLESLAIVRAARPDVHVFNELLILYPKAGAGTRNLIGVVPDNMVVVHPEPLDPGGHFALTMQPAGPLVVMEYVSPSNKRKDYDRNMTLYEQDLKVPYYLLFYPETQDLTVFTLRNGRYGSVDMDEHGRQPIPELELSVALLDGWVRYWFRGELLPLPGEMARDLDATRGQLQDANDEIARLRAELDRLKG